MPEPVASRTRWLDPIERISEVWFGLIMVLTLTCSRSVAQAGRADGRQMLIDSLGCNLAWGIIDAFMYLAASFSQSGQNIATLRSLRKNFDPDDLRRIFQNSLPMAFCKVLNKEEIASLTERINRLPEPPVRPRLTREDWLGALGIFLWVFLSTFPVVIPFLFFHEPLVALRISNAIAIILLFLTGYSFGRTSGYRPMAMGITVVVFAAALVGITIKLGG